MNYINLQNLNIPMPSKDDITALREGDEIMNCFGRKAVITRVFARGTDIEGRDYVCFYSRSDNGIEVSDAYKEDTIHRCLPLTCFMSSASISMIESVNRQERSRKHQ